MDEDLANLGFLFRLVILRHSARIITLALATLVLAGCSVNHFVINKASDALADGGSAFASDEDPELIRAAAPFSLKLMESLLSQNPKHRGLLLAASSGFTQYAFAFVQQDADEIEERDVKASVYMRERARRFYTRARDYGLRGLDSAHPGFLSTLRANSTSALSTTSVDDVALLYWTGVSWAAVISLSKDNPDVIADLPLVEALIYRALKLDESFDQGAIHGFLISYEISRPASGRDAESRVRKHFERTVELTQGQRVAPYVALAEAVSVTKQDRAEFEALLHQALAINVEARPEWKLSNIVMQRRARWLLSRTDQLFSE